jgi:hypothetical protein
VPLETPAQLAARLKLGREEFCQRLLTSLILDGPYPRWNTRSIPSGAGTEFLRRLHQLSVATAWPCEDLVFVDEFELPPRTEAERGGAPDYAVLWSNVVWMIELKTERASHRAAQIPQYFALAHHHHPDARIELTYLTPPMEYVFTAGDDPFAHVSWSDVVPLITDVWAVGKEPTTTEVVRGLVDIVSALDEPTSRWRTRFATAVPPKIDVDDAITLARLTARDGRQRALEAPNADLDDLLELRLEARDAIASDDDPNVRCVQPWLWRAATSGGEALTRSGRDTGVELRFSRYASPRS